MTSPLDTASSLLLWSNVIYVVGAVLTLGTSAMVLFEKRQAGKGIEVKHSVRNEVIFATSALICLSGTLGAIYFGGRVSDIKDADLAAYKVTAGVQIATANASAKEAETTSEKAQQKAEEARGKAEEARQKAESIRAKAEEARRNSLKAEKDAQDAVIDKEKILHDNLALQKQVEDERVARLQLELKIAPRELTKVAQDRLIAELRPLKFKDVDFVTFAGNAEAAHLASQIQFAFETAGAKMHPFSPMSGSLQGIIIEYDTSDASATKGARSVADALTASGIQQILSPNLPTMNSQLGAFTSDGGPGTAKIRIFFGSK